MNQSGFFVERLAIVGVGLIGGSLARALRQAGAVGEIVGSGRSVDTLQRAQSLGVIDRWTTDPAVAVADAQIAILAAPVSAMAALFGQIKPALKADCILSDVGSTKRSVLADAKAVFGEIPPNLVPAHPIAGTERSGVEASFAELFRDRRVILTPVSETATGAANTIEAMWVATGAQVTRMDAMHHDEVLAATSHLPHLLAYALVDHLAAMEDRREIFAYASGGFRDFTRIAGSSPEMWRDIACANGDALTAVLDGYLADLKQLRDAIASGDGARVLAVFQRAKQARDRFIGLAGPVVKGGT